MDPAGGRPGPARPEVAAASVGAGSAVLRLEPVVASAATARAWLQSRLADRVPGWVLDDLVLIATELISNSVQHTVSDHVELRVRAAAGSVTLQVRDQGPGLPPRRPIPGTRGRSRGLLLVDRLTSSLTCRAGPDGAVVTAVVTYSG